MTGGCVPVGSALAACAAAFALLCGADGVHGAEPPRGVAVSQASCAAAADESERHLGRALLVMKDGEIVFERYARGWSSERPHPLASGTKSFCGVLAARALQDGVIRSLDQPASDFITEWRSDPKAAGITVRQLLTLTSGLEPDPKALGPQGAGIRDLVDSQGQGPIATRLRKANEEAAARLPDRFQAVIGTPVTTAPGLRFRYGPAHFYAFGAMLERALAASSVPEKTLWDYMRARILIPCGIDAGLDRFAPDSAGKPNLPGGGHLTAREWARFGEMVRLGGRVRGQASSAPDATGGGADGSPGPGAAGAVQAVDPVEVVDAALLAACFQPSERNGAYGLTWWLLNGKGPGAAVADAAGAGAVERAGAAQAAQTRPVLDLDGRPITVVMAAGAGKQRLYVIPECGLVVVRFAAMGRGGMEYDDRAFLQALLGLTAQGAGAEPGPGANPPARQPPPRDPARAP